MPRRTHSWDADSWDSYSSYSSSANSNNNNNATTTTTATTSNVPTVTIGAVKTFAAGMPLAEDMLNSFEGSGLFSQNLYVDGLIYCNGIQQVSFPVTGCNVGVGATIYSSSSNSTTTTPTIPQALQGLNFQTNAELVAMGAVQTFTDNQLSAEELLSTTEGSQWVGSNLYVSGMIYCNGLQQIAVSGIPLNLSGGVVAGAPGAGGGGVQQQSNVVVISGSNGPVVQVYKTPVCISDLYVERLHFFEASQVRL